jgi:hypothetical protein
MTDGGQDAEYCWPVPTLEQLQAGHAPAVLAFELANRAYFAASISDRGDEFFEQFPELYSASLAEQEAGGCAFYVLVADDGSVLGRFNLYDVKDGSANLVDISAMCEGIPIQVTVYQLLASRACATSRPTGKWPDR